MATGFTAATAAASTAWGAAAKDMVDGASGAGGVTPPPSPGGAAATGGATAAAGSPTTVVVPSAATTSRAGSLAGTMPSSVARWASAGGDCRAATSRRNRSLRSLRSRAAPRASCRRYESAAAAVDSHSVATSPIPSRIITVSTNWARPGATARATVRVAGRARLASRWGRARPGATGCTVGRVALRVAAVAVRVLPALGRSMTGALIAQPRFARLALRASAVTSIRSLRSLICPPRGR